MKCKKMQFLSILFAAFVLFAAGVPANAAKYNISPKYRKYSAYKTTEEVTKEIKNAAKKNYDNVVNEIKKLEVRKAALQSTLNENGSYVWAAPEDVYVRNLDAKEQNAYKDRIADINKKIKALQTKKNLLKDEYDARKADYETLSSVIEAYKARFTTKENNDFAAAKRRYDEFTDKLNSQFSLITNNKEFANLRKGLYVPTREVSLMDVI